jgi:hypothetical protein
MSILKISKTLSVVVALSFGLTACNDIEGTLNANEDLTLTKDKKSISIPAGTYETKIESDSKEIEVKIKVGKKSQKFEFAIPKDALKDDTFDIPAEQTGQIYGLQGTRTIDEVMTAPRQDYESCEYYEYYTRCSTDARGNTRCWTERVTRWGQRWVEYVDRETTTTVSANLVNASGATAAEFDGSRTDVERIYRNQGICR